MVESLKSYVGEMYSPNHYLLQILRVPLASVDPNQIIMS